MKISIVVPAYNEEKLILNSLAAMKKAAGAFVGRGWETELIVCDNNSSDRTAELSRSAGAQVVFEPVNQISRARNRGARAATGDWLIFVDADSYPSAGLMEDVARAIESGWYLGGGAVVQLENVRGLTRFMNGVWNGISRTLGWAAGSFIFCDRAAFVALQGMSEDLYASEEIEFSRRLRRLARQRGKTTVILTCHPLVTSARRVQLCSRFEFGRMLWSTLWQRGGNLRRKEACGMWYDGRR
jgi:glycosyltransferase involved in cell wall biosynthesis